jgi:hypothetical protein
MTLLLGKSTRREEKNVSLLPNRISHTGESIDIYIFGIGSSRELSLGEMKASDKRERKKNRSVERESLSERRKK